MAQEIRLGKLSPTMETGTITRWLKKEGDKVSPGDAVCEVETDKANMPQEVFDEGTLLKILAPEGQTVKIDALIAVLGAPGEDISALKASPAAAKAQRPQAPEKQAAKPAAPPPPKQEAPAKESPAGEAPAARPESEERIKASPLARKLALERGIDLATIKPSGPGGRIIERDIPEKAPAPAAAAAAPRMAEEEIPLSNLRATIARRLVESKQTIPHFYLYTEVSAGRLVSLREDLNAGLLEGANGNTEGVLKISFNDLVVKAAALALARHPEVNASFQADSIRRHGAVNIAVAVATEAGLYTPVLHNVDGLDLAGIAAGLRELAQRARERRLKSEDLSGSGFTVTNLGMYGVDHFYAIINPPEAAVLAVGAIRQKPVVNSAGAVVAGQVLGLSLSCDHRVIDGAAGARFLDTVKNLLEHPARMGQF